MTRHFLTFTCRVSAPMQEIIPSNRVYPTKNLSFSCISAVLGNGYNPPLRVICTLKKIAKIRKRKIYFSAETADLACK